MPGTFRERCEEASHRYFTEFLPELRGQLLIPGLRSLSCVLGVRLSDVAEGSWSLHIEAGRLTAINAGLEGVSSTFQLDASTLMEIATGTLAPDRAFFDLRIEIEGDVAQGLQLSTVLEPFFKQHPFRLGHS